MSGPEISFFIWMYMRISQEKQTELLGHKNA